MNTGAQPLVPSVAHTMLPATPTYTTGQRVEVQTLTGGLMQLTSWLGGAQMHTTVVRLADISAVRMVSSSGGRH